MIPLRLCYKDTDGPASPPAWTGACRSRSRPTAPAANDPADALDLHLEDGGLVESCATRPIVSDGAGHRALYCPTGNHDFPSCSRCSERAQMKTSWRLMVLVGTMSVGGACYYRTAQAGDAARARAACRHKSRRASTRPTSATFDHVERVPESYRWLVDQPADRRDARRAPTTFAASVRSCRRRNLTRAVS